MRGRRMQRKSARELPQYESGFFERPVLSVLKLADNIEYCFIPPGCAGRITCDNGLHPVLAFLPLALGIRGAARVRQQDWLIHDAEPEKIFVSASYPNETQLDVRGLPEQSGNGAYRARGIAPGGKAPERWTTADIEAALARGLDKSRDGLVIRRSEKERLIELAVARKLGVARAQARIPGNFAWAHVVKAGDAHTTFLGNAVKSGADFFVRTALRDAKVPPHARGARNSQIKVAVREEDSAAVFRDKWMGMREFAPYWFDFRTSARREQNKCNMPPVELREGFLRAGKRIRARIDQCAFESAKNEMTRGKQGVEQCNLRW